MRNHNAAPQSSMASSSDKPPHFTSVVESSDPPLEHQEMDVDTPTSTSIDCQRNSIHPLAPISPMVRSGSLCDSGYTGLSDLLGKDERLGAMSQSVQRTQIDDDDDMEDLYWDP